MGSFRAMDHPPGPPSERPHTTQAYAYQAHSNLVLISEILDLGSSIVDLSIGICLLLRRVPPAPSQEQKPSREGRKEFA
jgi:hypothetical protein